jgi:hypothetical protein
VVGNKPKEPELKMKFGKATLKGIATVNFTASDIGEAEKWYSDFFGNQTLF